MRERDNAQPCPSPNHREAFLVPGALGALEGGFVLFGALFGLPADIALAIPLTKRVRELALGLPGLMVGSGLKDIISCAAATNSELEAPMTDAAIY